PMSSSIPHFPTTRWRLGERRAWLPVWEGPWLQCTNSMRWSAMMQRIKLHEPTKRKHAKLWSLISVIRLLRCRSASTVWLTNSRNANALTQKLHVISTVLTKSPSHYHQISPSISLAHLRKRSETTRISQEGNCTRSRLRKYHSLIPRIATTKAPSP